MKKVNAVLVKEKKELSMGDNSPAEMIRMAVSGKADLQQLKELLAIQKDWEANEARKIFTKSFASAQAKIASVIKTKINPQTHSKYADLGDIIKSAMPVYTAEGFSVIFYEGETAIPESIRICADVLHTAGHKETYHYDVPLDGVGIKGNANMTKIHAKASSTSYGRRYLMCMIWNIPTQDDNDGDSGATEFINQEEGNKILDMITSTGSNLEKFLTYMGVSGIETIAKKDYQKAMAALTAKAKKAGAK